MHHVWHTTKRWKIYTFTDIHRLLLRYYSIFHRFYVLYHGLAVLKTLTWASCEMKYKNHTKTDFSFNESNYFPVLCPQYITYRTVSTSRIFPRLCRDKFHTDPVVVSVDKRREKNIIILPFQNTARKASVSFPKHLPSGRGHTCSHRPDKIPPSAAHRDRYR